ncbi:TonB-dependent receptor [Wenzhouxiangella sp. AB-CW3]|nr:TonB-dependent receptor [Wenzhouxiangella sp. AB-CW3]
MALYCSPVFGESVAMSQSQGGAAGQSAGGADDEEDSARLEDVIVVTGTRVVGTDPTQTLSPVDVVASSSLANQATPDLTDGLSRVMPSFNTQRWPIADGTAIVRPVTLRNLAPDQTMVLVDGTRRHRSAMVNLQLAPLGTVNQGSQAVDFSLIPSAAVERIEVLRDGASAQYGSDAIAGVVNVILKDAPDGGTLFAQHGEYFEGDGTRTTVGGNAGFSLGTAGFLNASFEYTNSDQTSRGVPHADAGPIADVVGIDQVPLDGLGQRWGDPDAETWKFFVNAGVDLTSMVSLYSHASYADSEWRSDFFFRNPVMDPQLVPPRDTLQQGTPPDPAPQSLIDSILGQGLDPADYLVADDASPSGFILRNPIHTLFPGGYNPDFGADISDFAWVVGIDGMTDGGLSWDVRGRIAENKIDYMVSQTINPSMGRLSPTSFRPGSLTQQETSFNVDFVQPFDLDGLHSPLNVAFGLEYRDETYKIGAGDPASREAGPTASVFGLGSDGFQGFPLESAGSFSSDSLGAYVDLETDFTDRFSGGVAVRFEEYDEFGSTFDWKLSGRYDMTDQFALRATASTGFRAPTPGQMNTLNVTTTANPDGRLIPSGTYPVDHPVSVVLGAQPLEPEESQNFTIGFVANPFDNTSLTVDYYDIRVDDRLALRDNVISEGDLPGLIDLGVDNPELLVGSLANFFSNAFDSKVTGIDVASTSNFDIDAGALTLDLRYTYNRQKVRNVAPNTINDSRVFDLENQVPRHRTNLTLSFDSRAMFSGHVRASHYGSWETTGGLFSPGDASDVNSYSSEIIFDLEARFRFADQFQLAVGGENIFDTYPGEEQNPTLQFLGVKYALTSPFGFNGGQWYARLSYEF